MALTQGFVAFTGRSSSHARDGLRAVALFAAATLTCHATLVGCAVPHAAGSEPVKKGADEKAELAEVALVNAQNARALGVGQDRSLAAGHRRRMVPPRISRRAGPHPLGRRAETLHRRAASSSAKRGLVNRLLGDEYIEEYARNWTTLWTNLLIGRSGGTERRSLINREGLQQALRAPFERNKPYDRLVYELVSATGRAASLAKRTTTAP